MSLPRNLLVPIDLGDHTKEVVDYAVALAGRLDARVHLLHAVPVPLLGSEVPITCSETAVDEVIARRQRELDELAATYAATWVFASVALKPGDARTVITAAIEPLEINLIVMGTHGRRGVARLVVGSVAEHIVRVAPCPVLLVRSGTATVR